MGANRLDDCAVVVAGSFGPKRLDDGVVVVAGLSAAACVVPPKRLFVGVAVAPPKIPPVDGAAVVAAGVLELVPPNMLVAGADGVSCAGFGAKEKAEGAPAAAGCVAALPKEIVVGVAAGESVDVLGAPKAGKACEVLGFAAPKIEAPELLLVPKVTGAWAEVWAPAPKRGFAPVEAALLNRPPDGAAGFVVLSRGGAPAGVVEGKLKGVFATGVEEPPAPKFPNDTGACAGLNGLSFGASVVGVEKPLGVSLFVVLKLKVGAGVDPIETVLEISDDVLTDRLEIIPKVGKGEAGLLALPKILPAAAGVAAEVPPNRFEAGLLPSLAGGLKLKEDILIDR